MKSLLQYRKTVLVMCLALFGFFFFHLIGIYIYNNGTYIGLPGGSVAVGLVTQHKPDPFNPLSYGEGKHDDLLYSLLFRSLIRYNSQNEIFEGDLANCDITNIQKIQCQMRENAIWSDGTPINTDDIIATFQTFKEKAHSKAIQNAFQNMRLTAISPSEILIESDQKTSYIIEALSYPIIRSDVLDQIKNNRLKKESYITSGPFVYDESADDNEFGFHRITLKKNPNYTASNVWLSKFHFKIFPDIATLQRGITTVTIVIPPGHQDSIKLPTAFRAIKYKNYEFFGLFFQTQTLDKNLRNILHQYLAARFKDAPPSNSPLHHSIFLNGDEILGKSELAMDLTKFMTEKNFKKKETLLHEAQNQSTTLTSGGTIPKTKFFTNGGGNAILYSNDPSGEISLRGKATKNTVSVTINGYTLKEYTEGNTTFGYKISRALGNLTDGKNEYKLELLQKNGSILRDTLVIYHTLDENKMNAYKQGVEKSLLEALNTPEKVAEREQQKQEKIEKIQQLDDNLYYNEKFEPFTIRFAFANNKENITEYADFITNALHQRGIAVESIPLSTKEIDDLIKNKDKNYDIILLGVRSNNNIAYLGSNFFSSENGNPNFSGITDKKIVSLFDELRNISSLEKSTEIKQKITEYLNENSIFFPISQPERTIYIHMDVKGVTIPEIIANTSSFEPHFSTFSTKDTYQISTEGKSISDFFSWIFSQISSKNQSQNP